MATKIIKKNGKYYRLDDKGLQHEVELKDGYFTWTTPDKVKYRAKAEGNFTDMDKSESLLSKLGRIFTNATMSAANADAPAVTTASGWNRNSDGSWDQSKVDSEGAKQLRRSLAAISAVAYAPVVLASAPLAAPGTALGTSIGGGAGTMALGMALEEGLRAVAGLSTGDIISGKLQSYGVHPLIADMARPEYYFSPTGAATKAAWDAGSKVVLSVKSRFTPHGFRIGGYAYKPDMSTLHSGIPGKFKKTPIPENFQEIRGMWYEVDPDITNLLDEIPNTISLIKDGLSIRIPGGGRATRETTFSRMEPNFEFLEILNQQHKYGLDLDKYPRSHYEYDGTMGMFEWPEFGPKKLPLLAKGTRSNDVMYAHAHNMWNQLSRLTRSALEPIYAKIWKNVPTLGNYSPGERAFAVSKDIQTSIYNKFLTDNRVSVKGYDEWLEYIDDVPDELLYKLAKEVHGGYWVEHNNLDLSEQGLNALRETLKYNYGGKINS